MASASSLVLGTILLTLSVFSSAKADDTCPTKVVFCYYSSWAVYRPTFGKYIIDDIDPQLCTHLVYAFAGLNLEGVTFSLDPYNDLPEEGGNQQYYFFRMLKEKNPCLKVLLSIGGWDEGSEKYSIMADNTESRAKFADHLLRYIVYYGFDGIDLDWEYPSDRGGIPADRDNYAALLSDISKRFKPRGKLICVAVGAALRHVEPTGGYDVAKIGEHADYVLLMTYDYNKHDVTSHVAPMDSEDESVRTSVNKWIELGCPRNKLVLGILTSGRTFKLSDPQNRNIGAPVSGPGEARPYTAIPGFISYYEMCDSLLEETGWQLPVYTADRTSVYATNGVEWVTYEDEITIENKSQYAINEGLAGVLVYSIDTDDFRGFCKPEKNIMLKTVNDVVYKTKK